MSGFGSFVSGVAGGYAFGEKIKNDREEREARREERTWTREQRERQRREWADADEIRGIVRSTASGQPAPGQGGGPGAMPAQGEDMAQMVDPQPPPAAAPRPQGRRGYLDIVGPRVMEAYVRQGKLEHAKAWRDFIDSEDGRAYADDYANAIRAVTAGDYERAIPAIENLYNSRYKDGKRARTQHLGGGQYRVDILDEATGQVVNSRDLPADQLSMLAIGALNPMKMVEFTVQQQAKREAERATLDRQIQLEQTRQEGQEARDDRRDERTRMHIDAADRRLARQLDAREQRGGLTLPQERQNAEIEAAREIVAGLSPDEIRRRTTPTTATGRENPDYDPRLASAARLAGRRKIGADGWFDQRQSARGNTFQGKPLADMSDEQLDRYSQSRLPSQEVKERIEAERVRRSFAADPAMQNNSLGELVPGKGYRVLDSQGRHIGFWGRK